jgi:limonene-1,2-epoxide hydrolase
MFIIKPLNPFSQKLKWVACLNSIHNVTFLEYLVFTIMDSQALIETFYKAFAEGNAETMIQCYHEDVVFSDPAFGKLKGERAKSMWRMLLSNRQADTRIILLEARADEITGLAHWVAEYRFGPKKRKVINQVEARFKFKDQKIIEHKDHFDIWRWSRQALGVSGVLLGWTPFFQKKVKNMANGRLDAFLAK